MGTLIIILIFSKSFLKHKKFSVNMLYYGYHKITVFFIKKGRRTMDITEGIKKILKNAAPAEEEAKEDCACEEECSCEEKTETCDGNDCDNK